MVLVALFLEGLNYPYEFNPINYNCFGIDRDEQMIITAKANMTLHLLDKFTDPSFNKSDLIKKINTTFYQARNNGPGTLGELKQLPQLKVNLLRSLMQIMFLLMFHSI